MSDKKNFFNMFYRIAPGGAYAIAAIILRSCCEFIAMSLFPGYALTENMISDLGDYTLNLNLMGRVIFNGGFMISGMLILPYFFYLNDFYKNIDDGKVNENLRIGAIYTSIFSSIAISLIGFFLSFDSVIMFTFHGIFALIGFTLSAFSNLLWAGLMLQTSTFSKWLRYYGFLPTILCFIFIFTWIPLIEWITAYSISFFILTGSSNSLIKKY